MLAARSLDGSAHLSDEFQHGVEPVEFVDFLVHPVSGGSEVGYGNFHVIVAEQESDEGRLHGGVRQTFRVQRC